MLIEKSKFLSTELINLKLVNGDEIVGRLVDFSDGVYEINKPCIVITTNEGLGVLQAMFGLDPDAENLFYRDQHIVSMCHTHPKMAEHYESVLAKDEAVQKNTDQGSSISSG